MWIVITFCFKYSQFLQMWDPNISLDINSNVVKLNLGIGFIWSFHSYFNLNIFLILFIVYSIPSNQMPFNGFLSFFALFPNEEIVYWILFVLKQLGNNLFMGNECNPISNGICIMFEPPILWNGYDSISNGICTMFGNYISFQMK